MTLGIRGKLILVSLGLIVATLLVSDLALTTSLDRKLTERIRTDLTTRAELAAHDVVGRQSSTLDWEALAIELGARSKARVTLLSLDGRVLGDSEVSRQALPDIENHRFRPEIVQAVASGQGASVRHSTTTDQRMMYVAVRLQGAEGPAGLLRMALPLAQVNEAVTDLRKVLITASLLALAIAGAVAILATRRLSRTLRQLSHTAGRMAEGQLGERIRATGHDEIATLGQNLDHLAASLSKALAQLRAERDLLDDILSGMQEGVLVVDAKDRVIHANPALRAMLLLGHDAIGKPLLEAIRNADLVEILGKARTTGGTASSEVELSGLKPMRMWVEAMPMRGESGNLLLVLVDVTQLRQLESIRRDFVANASHELRTPVASMRSAAETLRSALDDPSASAMFIDMIERNASRLQQLVDDLLDLSRIESREFRLQPERVDLRAFAGHMRRTYASIAHERDINLEPIAPEGPDVFAQADRKALEQVMGNLLDNALKYCPKGSTVRIQLQAEKDFARITVEDNGPGIPPQHLPRLFERFYRVDAGRSRELGGTGLGLAIVKHLTEAMGGHTLVESQPGAGSRFSFTLPLC
ncbi:MAG: ATP-binding protein [Firmicutes bacterium]|nr:ATP-binding protein [Bacillota bacterium]